MRWSGGLSWTSTPVTTRNFALPFSSGTMTRPHQPRPTTATPSAISIPRRAGLLCDLRPALRLGCNVLREGGGTLARQGVGAAGGEAIDHCGRLHGLHRGRVQALDRLPRAAGP